MEVSCANLHRRRSSNLDFGFGNSGYGSWVHLQDILEKIAVTAQGLCLHWIPGM